MLIEAPVDLPVASDDLAIRLDQQSLVASFGMFALRALDVDQILERSCELAATGLSTGFAKLLAFRPESQDFIVRCGVGWKPGVVGNATVGADLASPAGYAFHTGLPVVSNHLAAETRFRTPAILADHDIRRAINVIVAVDGTLPFGVLEADSSGRAHFTAHDVAFLQSLANIVAAALKRQQQDSIQQALIREKEILIQEIHHRIKNSLQLVQTTLFLQARAGTESERFHLNNAAARVTSIAAVHQRLYEAGAVERVELVSYLRGLLSSIALSLGAKEEISVVAQPMRLPAEHMTPIGLIAVELITNALKYGGEPIHVEVTRTDEGVEILVQDNGPGFAIGFDPAATQSVGMRLIAAMARTPGALTIDRTTSQSRVRVSVAFAPLT